MGQRDQAHRRDDRSPAVAHHGAGLAAEVVEHPDVGQRRLDGRPDGLQDRRRPTLHGREVLLGATQLLTCVVHARLELGHPAPPGLLQQRLRRRSHGPQSPELVQRVVDVARPAPHLGERLLGRSGDLIEDGGRLQARTGEDVEQPLGGLDRGLHLQRRQSRPPTVHDDRRTGPLRQLLHLRPRRAQLSGRGPQVLGRAGQQGTSGRGARPGHDDAPGVCASTRPAHTRATRSSASR
ncbi:hypothetical protein ACI3ET_06810 [Ornithinimicrobium sp. LYQ121]|uniref:hypothetical protein n=1 Tax=Ornithinimicrobium sp. LYQ121 TaxID=3378801 RepID=UPI003853E627